MSKDGLSESKTVYLPSSHVCKDQSTDLSAYKVLNTSEKKQMIDEVTLRSGKQLPEVRLPQPFGPR